MENRVFKVVPDYSSIHDEAYDAVNIDEGRYDMIPSKLIGVRDVELPTEMNFSAKFSILSSRDYIINNMSIPIVHRRFISLLLEIQFFKIRLVPIKLFDDTLLNASDKTKEDLSVNEDFITFQLTEYLDAFNYEFSDFESDPILGVGDIKKLVLRRPSNSFPPLFRLKESRSDLFIDSRSKEVLTNAKIKGCLFEAVPVV